MVLVRGEESSKEIPRSLRRGLFVAMDSFAAVPFDGSREGVDVGGVFCGHEHLEEWNGVQCHRCVGGCAYCDCFRLDSSFDMIWVLWRVRVSCGDESRFGRFGMDVGSVTW